MEPAELRSLRQRIVDGDQISEDELRAIIVTLRAGRASAFTSSKTKKAAVVTAETISAADDLFADLSASPTVTPKGSMKDTKV